MARPVESTDDAADTAGDDPESAEHGAGSPTQPARRPTRLPRPGPRLRATASSAAGSRRIDLTSIQEVAPAAGSPPPTFVVPLPATRRRALAAGYERRRTCRFRREDGFRRHSGFRRGDNRRHEDRPRLESDEPPPSSLESADRDRTLAAPRPDGSPVRRDRPRFGSGGRGARGVRHQRSRRELRGGPETSAGRRSSGGRSRQTSRRSQDGCVRPGESERREPFQGVRKRIAEAMVESSTVPSRHSPRRSRRDGARRDTRATQTTCRAGINLTYMPFITKAVIAALKEYPEMNAVLDEENEEIVYRDYYNIGIAAATDNGLMVPVVENADRKGCCRCPRRRTSWPKGT